MSSNQHIEIVPSNITSDGKLSYKNGQPTIQLLIGAQERFIVPGSVRLCGEITIKKNDTTLPVESDGIRMNERLGVHSVIDTLSIFSQRSSQTIETINHHNRFMSSYLSVTQSQGDFARHAYETSLRFPNYKAQQLGVIQNTQADPSTGDSPNSFCIPLVSGLFLGQDPIPLSNSWGVGGLLIEIQLSPDQNVLFSADNTDTNLLDAYYELSNVRLICEVQTPGPDFKPQMTNTFTYNSISSYYNTINSRNAVLNFNLGLRSVLGAFMNVVPSAHINSWTRDGLATLGFSNKDASRAKVNQLVFTRAGQRVPLEYNIDTLQKTEKSGFINENADSQIVRNYMNAVQNFAKINRTSVGPETYRSIGYGTNYADAKTIVKGGSAWGIGVAYDSISNQGLDFAQVPFGVQLDLELTSDHPNAVFLFVHSRQTIVSSDNSIQVMK